MLASSVIVYNDNNIFSRIAAAKHFLCLPKFFFFSVPSLFCMNLIFYVKRKQFIIINYSSLLHNPAFNQFKPLLYWRIPLNCWEQLLMGLLISLNIQTFQDTIWWLHRRLDLSWEMQFCLHLTNPWRVSYNRGTVTYIFYFT